MINYDNPQIAVQVHPIPSFGTAGFMQFSVNGGLSWTPSTTPPPNATNQNTNFYPPLIEDPSNSDRFYFGSDQLAISEDDGVTWGTSYTFPGGGQQNVPGDPDTGCPAAIWTDPDFRHRGWAGVRGFCTPLRSA